MVRRIVIILIAVFFALSAAILFVTGTALLLPGTPLDAIWNLNEGRRDLLAPYASYMGPAFIALGIPMALASLGCFMRRRWGLWLAVAIFAVNGLGDAVQLLSGHIPEGALGTAVALAVIVFLTRPYVRSEFR